MWRTRVYSVYLLLALLVTSCGEVNDLSIKEAPVASQASCTPLYVSDQRKATQPSIGYMQSALDDSTLHRFMNARLKASGVLSPICWKVVSQNTRNRTIVAVGQSGPFTFSSKGTLTLNSFGGLRGTFWDFYFFFTSNANTSKPNRHIVNYTNGNIGKGTISVITQVGGQASKIYDYPRRGPWQGSGSIGSMTNFANPSTSSSQSTFQYNDEFKSFNLVPQATSGTFINMGNGTPVVSVKTVMEERGLSVQFDSECESQKFPNDPCPGPPTVVPIPSPNVTVEICQKRECGDNFWSFARQYGLTVAAEFRLLYDTGKTLVTCGAVLRGAPVQPCGMSAGMVTVDFTLTVVGAKSTESSWSDFRSCQQARRVDCR